jgi:hypothetical protein
MENQNEYVRENENEWQAPPPPETPSKEEPPRMSEASTLGNIFFEPGETFEDLRRKPRFVFALLISVALITLFMALFFSKIGEDQIRRSVTEQFDKNPMAASVPAEQRKQQIDMQVTITKYLPFAIGGLAYWIGGKAVGGDGNFLHGLSVYVYSSFPPVVVSMLANLVVLFLKSAEEMDFAANQRGLVQANPSFFLDAKEAPVLTTLISTLDLFAIWGWILAAIGLHKVMKISKGSAWAVVIIFALIGIAYRVISAYFSGTAM